MNQALTWPQTLCSKDRVVNNTDVNPAQGTFIMVGRVEPADKYINKIIRELSKC